MIFLLLQRKEKSDLAFADAEKKKTNYAAGKMFGVRTTYSELKIYQLS